MAAVAALFACATGQAATVTGTADAGGGILIYQQLLPGEVAGFELTIASSSPLDFVTLAAVNNTREFYRLPGNGISILNIPYPDGNCLSPGVTSCGNFTEITFDGSKLTFTFAGMSEIGAAADCADPQGPLGLCYRAVDYTGWYFRARTSPDATWSLTSSAVQGVPEPARWALLILGFGAIGAVIRTSRRRSHSLSV